jgi:hypothetical protein
MGGQERAKTMHRLCKTGLVLGWLMMVLAGGVWSSVPPTIAQDDPGGLTEAEQILLERFFEALDKRTTYTNYAQTSFESDVQELTYTIGGIESRLATGQLMETQQIAIRTPEGLDRRVIVSLQWQETTSSGVDTYLMSAEIRVVDGVLYIQAAYNDRTGNVPELPTGWIKLENPDDFPAFVTLNLAQYLTERPILYNRDTLIEALSGIRIENTTLEDGQTAESISLAFRGEGFEAAFKSLQAPSAPVHDEENPFFSQLFANLQPDSEVLMSIALDRDNNPLVFAFDIRLNSLPLDLTLINAENFQAGDTIRASLRVRRQVTLVRFNTAKVDPVTIPELPDS